MRKLVNSRQAKIAVEKHESCQGVVLVDPPLPGDTNMAIDEALLRHATRDWPVVVRIYSWERPTVSLGHFQDIADREQCHGIEELPWVRRRTGGGAIVHDQELTYSILIPHRESAPPKGHSEKLYRAIHQELANDLQSLGWDAKLSENCTCSTSSGDSVLAAPKDKESFLCFLRRTPVDLLVGKHKILGSAQRRTASGLLQHGSVLLRHSLSTPSLLGLLDIVRKKDPCTTRDLHSHPLESFTFSELRMRDLNPPYQFSVDDEAGVDLSAWSSFLVCVLKRGLSRVLNCTWQEEIPDIVLESVAPWRRFAKESVEF
jgi:lipoate-protein ligase A